MVAAGKKAAPEVEWLHQDLGAWQPAQKYDVIYSNAALHWLPDHAGLFPALMEKVEPGGILAVQMPRNFGAPSHLLIARNRAERTMAQPGRASGNAAAGRAKPAFYHDLLAPLSAQHRHLGDRVSPGPGRRKSGQGMDQGHLADALSGRPARATRKRRSKRPMASALRRPIRRIRRARRCFRSGDCSWWRSARADAGIAMRHDGCRQMTAWRDGRESAAITAALGSTRDRCQFGLGLVVRRRLCCHY